MFDSLDARRGVFWIGGMRHACRDRCFPRANAAQPARQKTASCSRARMIGESRPRRPRRPYLLILPRITTTTRMDGPARDGNLRGFQTLLRLA